MAEITGNGSGEFQYATGKVFDAQWMTFGEKTKLVLAFEANDPETTEPMTVQYFWAVTSCNTATGKEEPIDDRQYGFRLADLDALGCPASRVEELGNIASDMPREKRIALFPKSARLKMGKNARGYWEVKSLFPVARTIQVKPENAVTKDSVRALLRRLPTPTRTAPVTTPGAVGGEDIPF